MMIGIQIAVEVAVDGQTASAGLPPNARITDDLVERITDDVQIRIID